MPMSIIIILIEEIHEPCGYPDYETKLAHFLFRSRPHELCLADNDITPIEQYPR